MNRNPRRRSSTTSCTTASTPRWRGSWPSVLHTEQNEQCFGQPRTVCTDAHMYRSGGSRSQRARRKWSASIFPPSWTPSSLAVEAAFDRLAPRDVAVTLDDGVAARRGRALRPDTAWRECRRRRRTHRGRGRSGRPRIRAGRCPCGCRCRRRRPRAIVDGSSCSSVSSVMRGSPYSDGVAAAKT